MDIVTSFRKFSREMQTEYKNIGTIVDIFSNLQKRIDISLPANIKNHILETQTYPRPYHPTGYNFLWDMTDDYGRFIDINRTQLQRIKLIIDTLIPRYEEAEFDRIAFRDALNKNQMKFGLAGLSRTVVDDHIEENPTIEDGLSEFYRSILEQEPYSVRLGGSSRKNIISCRGRKTTKRKRKKR